MLADKLLNHLHVQAAKTAKWKFKKTTICIYLRNLIERLIKAGRLLHRLVQFINIFRVFLEINNNYYKK